MTELKNIKDTATTEEWNDWHWQLRNRITTFEDLEQYIKLQNPRAHQVGSQIFEMITSLVDEPVNDSERFYIVLHIQRLL